MTLFDDLQRGDNDGQIIYAFPIFDLLGKPLEYFATTVRCDGVDVTMFVTVYLANGKWFCTLTATAQHGVSTIAPVKLKTHAPLAVDFYRAVPWGATKAIYNHIWDRNLLMSHPVNGEARGIIREAAAEAKRIRSDFIAKNFRLAEVSNDD
jgi:hypothetical protein